MALSPLFDIYDPSGVLRQQAALDDEDDFDVIGIAPLTRRPQISDLMPEEEKRSMLQTLASAGSSGLAGLGWLLDTPGAVIRGGLSGGPMKALSALWDTTDERVDGRELLRQYGLVGKEDTWGSFGLGLGAEVLLDPLTYASFGLNQVIGQGAKTAAGKAAAKAGLLDNVDLLAKQADTGPRQFLRQATPESLIDRLAKSGQREVADAARQKIIDEAGEEALTQTLTKSNRYWLPGFGEGATDLYGKKAGDFLAWAGDELNQFVMTNPYTGPIATRAVAAFDPAVMGQTDYARQWEAREMTAARKARERADRAKLVALQRNAEAALQKAGSSLNQQDVSGAIRTYLEQGYAPEGMESILDLPEVQALTGFFEGYRDYAPIAARERGIPLDVLRPREGGSIVPRQQVRFDVPEAPAWPDGVVPPERRRSPWGRAPKPVDISDRGGKRRDYTAVMGATDTLNQMSLDADLQAALRRATPAQSQDIIREWVADNLGGGDDLYSWIDEVGDDGEFLHSVPDLPADHPMLQRKEELTKQLIQAGRSGEMSRVADIQKQLDAVRTQIPDARDYYRDQMYRQLGDMYRYLDPQHASRGIPVFGGNTFNTIADYVLGRGRAESTADSMLDILARNKEDIAADAVEGGVNVSAKDALKQLGFTDDAIRALEKRTGTPVDSMSFNKKFVQQWTEPMLKGRAPPEINPILDAADNFTKSFKTLALAWPSRITRDAYSGAFAASMLNSFNPFDWYAGTQMRRANYKPLTEGMLGGLVPPRLAKGQYAKLFEESPEKALQQFLVDAGAQGLGTSTVSDEALEGSTAALRELFPGGAAPASESLLDRFANAKLFRGLNPLRSDYSPFAVRTASGNRNPILEMFDRAAETTDAGNRFGTYLNQIRQNADPVEAQRIANLTQVDYRPEAFTDFERRYLKRIMPFYSYTRGIMPLIADEVINRPAGKMGQSIRAVNRAGQPSEDNFVPEYLRQSASVPLPPGLPLVGLDENSPLRRFLTNIDLPFESAINLFTPGTGNTLFQQAGNTLTKTALNLLGQTNPLIKGPLEGITNRQFYSGRQLSDLYSMLEQTMGAPGRTAEQVISNLPGGSRVLGLTRQLSDDRLGGAEKWSKILVNALTGLKFQDVDMDRTRRLAARDMLNDLLATTPGVRTYENITVPEDVLRSMPKEQKDMYLLYKIIQSEAAKRARDKKRAESALDPLEVLGAIRQA